MLELIGDGAQMGFWWIMDHLLFINIFLSILIIFFQRKNPMTVWAWLLILYFIPVLGFGLYLLLGQNFRKADRSGDPARSQRLSSSPLSGKRGF